MALLVLCSTLSVTVEQHYCGQYLVDSSWFGHAKSCGMEMPQASSSSSDCEFVQTGCCSNKIFHIEGQDELNSAVSPCALEQLDFVALIAPSFQCLTLPCGENYHVFKNYNPPKLVRNVQVLNQTFLIWFFRFLTIVPWDKDRTASCYPTRTPMILKKQIYKICSIKASNF